MPHRASAASRYVCTLFQHQRVREQCLCTSRSSRVALFAPLRRLDMLQTSGRSTCNHRLIDLKAKGSSCQTPSLGAKRLKCIRL